MIGSALITSITKYLQLHSNILATTNKTLGTTNYVVAITDNTISTS